VNDNWAEQILNVLIKRAGGEISISIEEFMDAEKSMLYMDHDFTTGRYKFKVEDNSVVQGLVL
jgi:hypothetical protein